MTSEQIRILTLENYQTKSKITLSNSQVYFLPIEVVLTHRLVASIVLTESQVELIEFEAMLFETFAKAKQYLAMRDHSSGELRIKLKKTKMLCGIKWIKLIWELLRGGRKLKMVSMVRVIS